MLSCFSCVQLFATLWTEVHQAPLSRGFSRQEYWRGCHALLRALLLTHGSNPHLLCLLHWQVSSLPLGPLGKPLLLSHFSHFQLFETLWIIACQGPLSRGFSRQEYWSGLPCPSLGDLPDPGVKPASLMSLALEGGLFTTSATRQLILFLCKLSIRLLE